MAKLTYCMLQSLDGYVEDAQGTFDWAAPDEELHGFVNELSASVGTYLYGRRMYETMVYWETADKEPGQPQVAIDWAKQWQATEKIVYSRTLSAPRSARTRIERTFDPDAVRALKAKAQRDLSIEGPELAGQALRAGLVDEVQTIVFPLIVGGGKRFFPNDVRLDLELLDERRFASGVVVMRYACKR